MPEPLDVEPVEEPQYIEGFAIDPRFPLPATLPTPIWEQWSGEPTNWYSRFHEYLRLGQERSINRAMSVIGVYSQHSTGEWSTKAKQWYWKQRAGVWDAHQATEATKRKAAAMQSGYALEELRVELLKEIAIDEARIVRRTLSELEKDPTGDRMRLNRRYEVMKGSLDSTLDALAKETGGRIKRITIHRDIMDFARQLALEHGYDMNLALETAKLLEQEAKDG